MNLTKLQNIDSLYLSSDDIARELCISKKSAQVTASRYVNADKLIRLKRDLFLLPQKLRTISEEELFSIANLLQTPSYISLTSALSYYNISTQQTRNYIESIGLKRSINFRINDYEFSFSKVKEIYYSGFYKNENFFIATPEKAIADSIYLTAIGRYNCDFEAIDFNKLNKSGIDSFLSKTNKAAQNLWQRLTRNYGL